MKKIVLYADWTDVIGHLTSFYAVCENEERKTQEQIEKEKQEYLKMNLNGFFTNIKALREQGYEVDVHILTGGTREYIMPMLMEVLQHAKDYDELEIFKSLTLEYGSENINIKRYIENYGLKYAEGQPLTPECYTVIASSDPKKAFPEKKTTEVKSTLEKTGLAEVHTTAPYMYMQNVLLGNENVTEEDFKEFCKYVRAVYGDKYSFYEYYCPGYGVEIDVIAKNNDKANGVKSIKELYYKGKGSDVDLEVIVGDYTDVELPILNQTINQNVLVTATEDSSSLGMTKESLTTDIPPHLMQSKQKIGALINTLSKLLNDVKNYDGFGVNPFSKYDKEDYIY